MTVCVTVKFTESQLRNRPGTFLQIFPSKLKVNVVCLPERRGKNTCDSEKQLVKALLGEP